MSEWARDGWIALWRAAQRYHRYTVEGFEHLEGSGAALVVGYHGSPVAWDMCMLMVRVYDRLGYFPHGVTHRWTDDYAPLRAFNEALGAVTADGERMAAAIARGEHIFTTPGGSSEACRGPRHRYRVDWADHLGYLRLALKHGLSIVPVAAAGTDDAYIGLNDANALGRWLGLPRNFQGLAWLGLGPLGFFPFSPPFPVRMRQLIGPPIDLRAAGARVDDHASLVRAHRHVTGVVQEVLDRARGTARVANGGVHG